MMPRAVLLLPILALLGTAAEAAAAEWTYRGTLSSYGKAAEGVHALRLTPYDAAQGGRALAPTIDLSRVEVAAGRFAVDVDFADPALQTGEFWLAVEVARDGGTFHLLPARQYVDLKQALSVCWDTLGNAATDGANNFLGTLDDARLGFRVNNTPAGFIAPATVVGGTPNIVLGSSVNDAPPGVQGAAVGGGGNPGAGNVVFSDFGAIAGGTQNTIGSALVTTANHAAIAGGFSNEALAGFAAIGGGRQNSASGSHGVVGGGQNNDARTFYTTIPGGFQAVATRYGQLVHGAGGFPSTPGSGNADIGSAQTSVHVLRREGVGALELTLDGGTPDASSRLVLAIDQTLAFDLLVAARDVADGQSASYAFHGVIKNVAGVTSLIAGSATPTQVREDVAGWNVSIAASDAFDALTITGTNGGSGENIRWVATLRTSEIAMDDL